MPTTAPATRSRTVIDHVPDAGQWISTTDGRIAADPSSWMQAVHWAADHADFHTGRSHGPRRLSKTTIRVAQVLADLTEDCRPGVAYLARQLKMSARTVKYHLALLRETGLLAYRSKGTRVAGVGGRASEYQRVIPPRYDRDVHLRTRHSDTLIRTVVGIEDEGRPLMRTLCRKAARRVRAPRSQPAQKPPVTQPAPGPRCTPRVGGSTGSSSDGLTLVPSESGQDATNDDTSSNPGARSLNRVGRRHQLARELVEQVPWLTRASVQRIAWIVRHVADAGWTAQEVIAVLALSPAAATVRRPSGFLAHRLRGAELLYDTPDKRRNIVTWWRDSRTAAQQRHAEWDTTWTAPTSRAVTRAVNSALTSAHQPEPGPAAPALPTGADGLTDLSQLDRRDIAALRLAATHDFGLVHATITHCGEPYARRLFTHRLVDLATTATRTGSTLLRLHTAWGQA